MKLEKFIAGTYTQHKEYKAFLPVPINNSWEWDNAEVSALLEQASMEFGGLNSFSDLIPNIDMYITMHIYTEANKSSKIEGTKTSIQEDLLSIEDISPEKRNDYVEVHNYINALNYGIKRIVEDDFPLSNRLICEMHEILMQGVRGERKTPGEFRRSQNWIGGTMPSNAVYVPPHIMYLGELLSDFEKFIHNDKLHVPHLIKVALLHYQFESIHPFLDGNGRIGRLLIPLYLLSKGILAKPCFYISDYLEKHRDAYYEALDRVRLKNDITHWIKFFLQACIYTAQGAKHKFKQVVALVEDYNNRLAEISGKYVNNKAILETFYADPLQSSREIQEKTELTNPTVTRALKQMLECGILSEITGYSRNRVYALKEYFLIFAGTSIEEGELN